MQVGPFVSCSFESCLFRIGLDLEVVLRQVYLSADGLFAERLFDSLFGLEAESE